MAGGPRYGRQVKAVIPGGSSAKVLRADERFKLKLKQPDGSMAEQEVSLYEIPMDFDTLAAAGSMAGSGGVGNYGGGPENKRLLLAHEGALLL